MNHRLNRIARLAVAGAICLSANAVFAQESPTAAEVLRIRWVNPPPKAPTGVRHGTFHSACMDTAVGYNIYLPPAYDGEPGRRFPVVYFLHGSAGNESRSIRLATYLHAAIEAGDVPPMLMVFANGGRNSGYIDSIDGTVRPETMIVHELIARDRLEELKIAFEFELVQGVDHNIYKLYDHAGLEGLQLHARHFSDAPSG